MTFFDLNCMLGPTMTNCGPSFQTVPDLLREMERVGIDEALVYASASRTAHPSDGNTWLSKVLRDQPSLHACWVGLPPGTGEQPPPDELVAQMKEQQVRALRLMPNAHRYPLVEQSLRPLLSALASAKIPVLIDMDRGGWSEISHDWRELLEISRRHPGLPLVLLREGGTTARVLFSVWQDHPNIYLEASYIQESRIIEEISTRFGTDRLLFGSAMPRYDAGGPITSVRFATVDEQTRADIAGNNARRLLGLPVAEGEAMADSRMNSHGFRVFDTHGHLGRWGSKYYSDWSAQQMIDYMDQLGIERFCVSDLLALGSDVEAGNNRVGEAVKQFPDRIHGYAVYNPNYESQMADEMKRCFDELGCSGIKLHCAMHETFTTDPGYRLAFQIAHERRCPMLCHTGGGPSSEFFKNILADYPDCQFIYAHVGGEVKALWEPLIEAANICPNFFLELSLSSMPRNGLARLVKECPVSQILYGSDHPLNDFTFQLGRVLYADIDDNAKKMILWDNAARIFNIN